MPNHDRFLWVYFQLAEISQQKKQFHPRDKFLILAGVEACRAGYLEIANRAREIILDHNSNHLLKKQTSFADAMRDEEFLHFVTSLEKSFCNREQAEHLLFQASGAPGDSEALPKYDQPSDSELASLIQSSLDSELWKTN